MPYITASIILQLLTVVIPRLEQLQQGRPVRPGEDHAVHPLPDARPRDSAVVGVRGAGPIRPALLQPAVTQLPDHPGKHQIWTCRSPLTVLVITMTAGTGVVMWLGELITDRGVGNGMSVLIFTSIAARLPTEGWQIQTAKGPGVFFLVLAIGVLVIAGVVFIEQAQRRIPGAVRQAHDRPTDVRRHVDLHPAQGQPGGRHPGDLRVVAAVPAAAGARFHEPQRPERVLYLRRQLHRRPDELGQHLALLPADHLLHVLLRRRSRSTRPRSRTT